MPTRLRTRTRIELEVVRRLLDQVGVANELVRGTTWAAGALTEGRALPDAEQVALTRRDLLGAQNLLYQAMITLRALRDDA